jgi:hypothetical protein
MLYNEIGAGTIGHMSDLIGAAVLVEHGAGDHFWTFFAPAERASEDELWRGLELVSQDLGAQLLLQRSPGLAALLNEHRQVLAVNDNVLKVLGIESVGAVIGLRPGEALGCIHAAEMPGGCGTSFPCADCGAVLAILACMVQDCPVEGPCTIRVERQGQPVELVFHARCVPLEISRRRFLLLFLFPRQPGSPLPPAAPIV